VNLKGDSHVPASYIEPDSEFKLGSWVARQRRVRSQLDGDKFNKLSALPKWTWNSKLENEKDKSLIGITSKVGWYKINKKIIYFPLNVEFNYKYIEYENTYYLFNVNYVLFKLNGVILNKINIVEDKLTTKCYKCEKIIKFDISVTDAKLCKKCGINFDFFNKFL
jgi:hypothetical protein